MELMLALFNIGQGIITTIMNSAGFGTVSYTHLDVYKRQDMEREFLRPEKCDMKWQ